MSSVSNNFRSQVSGLGVSGVRCQIAAYTRCRVSAVDTVKSFVSQSVYCRHGEEFRLSVCIFKTR